MGNVFAIMRRDIVRVLRVPAAWIIMLGLIVIPPMYAWFNIVGFWNPYGNTGGIRVSVANNDRGATSTLTGETNLGDQLVEQLRANHDLGWTFVSERQAMDDVRSGQSYAAIIIPANFSERLVDTIEGHGQRPELAYYVNEKASAIAPKVTDVGANTIDRQVNSTFVSTVSSVVGSALNDTERQWQDATGSAGSKARKALRAASQNVSEIRSTIKDLDKTLDGAPQKTQQARDALESVRRIGNDASGALSTTSSLITHAQGSLGSFASSTSAELDKGSSLLSQAVAKASGGVSGVSGSMVVANGYVANALHTAQSVTETNASIIEQLKHLQLPAIPGVSGQLQALLEQLQTANDNAKGTIDDLTTLNTDTAATATSVGKLADHVNASTQQALSTTDSARHALSSGAMPELNQGLTQLAITSGSIGASIQGQSALIDQADTVLDQLDTAVSSTRQALRDTDTALADVQDALSTLDTDLTALGDANLLSNLVGEDGALNTDAIADFMLSPTVLHTTTLYPVPSYGSGMAPLFINLSLWVGAFVFMVIVRLEVDDDDLDVMRKATVTPSQRYLARYCTIALLAIIQSTACTCGALALGVQTVNPLMFVLTGVITSLVYLSITYALSTTFLHVGKGLCVALVIVQIPGASGLYPIEMMPTFFRVLYPFFPFTYSIDAFRETIGGFYDGVWLRSVGALLVFAVCAFLLGLAVRPKLVNVNRLFAREINESGIIIGESVQLPGSGYRLSNLMSALADKEEYRTAIEERAARFTVLYPKLKRAALAAGIVVPAVLIVVFSLTTGTALAAFAAWLIWILLIIGFLMVIESINDNLQRQVALGNLGDDAIRELIATRRRRYGRGHHAQQTAASATPLVSASSAPAPAPAPVSPAPASATPSAPASAEHPNIIAREEGAQA